MNGRRQRSLLGWFILILLVLVNLVRLQPQLPPHQQLASVQELVAVNSATGVLFSGQPFRSFTGPRQRGTPSLVHRHANVSTCEFWSVVTTIASGPTEAIQTVTNLPNWCTAIVADVQTPPFPDLGSHVHFLSVAGQEQWGRQQGGAIQQFVSSIPHRHFARKNIGYLYAVQQGARFIFDVDDDNVLQTNGDGVTIPPLTNRTHLELVHIPELQSAVMNHHPLMQASIDGSWPRGFPLEQLQDVATQGSLGTTHAAISLDEIAVLQFCADGDPDIDAIHRLVKPLPMNFQQTDHSLLVPRPAFGPYNAQANVHTYPALWALLLPHTVTGRVSDIWRSYFAQPLFHQLGLSLVFRPPQVRHDRNDHRHLADMQAELDLYFKSGKLIAFLSESSGSASTLPGRVEEMWIALYERGYIEQEDVTAMQLWLAALVEVGYQFPTLAKQASVIREKPEV